MQKHKIKSKFTDNHALRLYRAAQKTPEELFQTLKTSYKGLSKKECQNRLKLFGPNSSNVHHNQSAFSILVHCVRNPINYLVAGLALASELAGNYRAALLMIIVVLMSILMTFIQEFRFNRVVNRLLKMTQVSVTVIRDYPEQTALKFQLPNTNHIIPIGELVPGDIVRLSPGDIIPADIRLLSAKNLLLNQSVLTGESVPIAKDSDYDDALLKNLPNLKNVCFFGSFVVNGSGIGVVLHTGNEVYVNSISAHENTKTQTSFDMGAQHYVIRTLKYMLIMIPLILLISYASKGNWMGSLLFAITITVSLTPKSLPLTISGNLTRAALAMMKKRVIVKHVSAIQNLGAMDVLCTDKTGTLTEDLSICDGAFNTFNNEDSKVLLYAYLNSLFQTGLKNHLDFALIKYAEKIHLQDTMSKFTYVDELSFDPNRKRSSILVKNDAGNTILICKGALEEILPLCTTIADEKISNNILTKNNQSYINMTQRINELGHQAIAVAYKLVPNTKHNCTAEDECELNLIGYIAFLDPPLKEDIQSFFKSLTEYGVHLKILTGDNHWDAMKVVKESGLTCEKILLGSQIDQLSDKDLQVAVKKTSIFAKLSPEQKQRIIRIFQLNGNTVGYLGDGINDVPALHTADVGIAVNNAVSTAKESSDIVLLDKNIIVLIEGILQGRMAFNNIMKYTKISSMTKFGTAISMLGASVFLNFLPMKPIQMLVQNLLFDFSQMGIPFDDIDKKQLIKPSKWEFTEIQKLRHLFGPIITLFDVILFLIMLYFFQTKTIASQSLFQTGWLVESLVTQALIIHLFNLKKIPFIQVKKPNASLITTFVSILIGILIPFSPLAEVLGFVPLPKIYFAWLIGLVILYCFVVTFVRKILSQKYNLNPYL